MHRSRAARFNAKRHQHRPSSPSSLPPSLPPLPSSMLLRHEWSPLVLIHWLATTVFAYLIWIFFTSDTRTPVSSIRSIIVSRRLNPFYEFFSDNRRVYYGFWMRNEQAWSISAGFRRIEVIRSKGNFVTFLLNSVSKRLTLLSIVPIVMR